MTPRWHKPLIFVVSAPSGAGKTTLCQEAIQRLQGIRFSVSHTTRPRRAGEVDGKDYHFVSRETFQRLIEAGGFLEWAEVHGNLYGTSWEELKRAEKEEQDLILEIDVQGAATVRQKLPQAITIFIFPPSLEALRSRLERRGTNTPEEIQKRLGVAQKEMAEAPNYQYWIVNEDLATATETFISIIRAERARREHLLPYRHPFGSLLS